VRCSLSVLDVREGLKERTKTADANRQGEASIGPRKGSKAHAMIVVCEKCSTRFRLDEGRVPVDGVKVRCSRCRHRFLVKAQASPGDAEPEAARGVEDTPPTPRDEEPDLENPQFLHDQGPPSKASTPPPPPPSGQQPPPETQDSLAEEEDKLFDAEESAHSGPEPDLDFASGLSLDTDEPTPEVTSSEAAAEAWLDLGDEPDFDIGGSPGRESSKPTFEPPAAESEIPDLATEARQEAPVAAKKEPEAPQEAPPAPTPDPRPRRVEAPGGTPLPLQIAAIAVGVLLAAGALRSLAFVFLGEPSRPVAIQGEGWAAEDLQTFHVRELTGERILVVRGRLRSEARGVRPRVFGALLNAEGRALGEEIGALPVWVADESLRPDRVGTLLRTSATARTGAEGFTLLFREPSGEARRIAIQLRSPGGA
jgi:predicted Zn finger-like uncharacterized protein